MTFAEPQALALAVAVAVVFVLAVVAGMHRARAAALDYSSVTFLDAALGRGIPWTAFFATAWTLAILAAGFAFARPSVRALVPVRDGAVVLCIDTSGSMGSTDVVPTRIAAARAAAGAFVNDLPVGTKIAVVSFSGTAIPLGPLVADRDTVDQELDRIPVPNGATAIGDALQTAANLLPSGGRRAIVLVTDGVNNRGSDPLAVAADLGARGIVLFTVGIGTNGSGTLIPGTDEDAGLDEDALRTIAADGHGNYARAADAAALRSRLTTLASEAIREPGRIDLTAAFADGGTLLALVAVFGSAFLGRFP